MIIYDDESNFINDTNTSLVEDFENWHFGSTNSKYEDQISYTGRLYICSNSLCNNFNGGRPNSKTLVSNGTEDFTLTFDNAVTELGFNTYIN